MASIDKVDFPEGSDITGACDAQLLRLEKEAKKNTANGGMGGVSREISLNTGVTSQGNSGPVIIDTGNATLESGGDFRVHVGKSTKADG
eukprot:13285629-Ditylum_brightwellii.AAC.1